MKLLNWLILASILLLFPINSLALTNICGLGSYPCGGSPVEGITLQNTQTTGAATTAVVVTLSAVQNVRHHIYSVEARCNTGAATSNLTITDGGTTIWTTAAAEVGSAANFVRVFGSALTGATNSQVVITLAACTAGTGTLIIQADRF
jgi:hypothetical protein